MVPTHDTRRETIVSSFGRHDIKKRVCCLMMLNVVFGIVIWVTFTHSVIAEDKKSSVYDFGLDVEHNLTQRSQQLFGIVRPLEAPASDADFVPRADARADQRVKLAEGLQPAF